MNAAAVLTRLRECLFDESAFPLPSHRIAYLKDIGDPDNDVMDLCKRKSCTAQTSSEFKTPTSIDQ